MNDFRDFFFADGRHCFPGIVSAPLWDSSTSTFAGLLTTSDYINVIQYYFQNPAALDQIDQFRLNSLRGATSQCDCLVAASESLDRS